MQNYPTTRCAEIAQPVSEPVSLAEAKAHVRVTASDENDLITALIVAARQYCENLSGRTLAPRNFLQTMDRFPDGGGDITLRRSPVTAVASVYYYSLETTNTLMSPSTDYRLDLQQIPARIRLPLGTTLWKNAYTTDDAVRITYTAGAVSAPTAAKQTILLLVGHWFENRESVVIGGGGREIDCTVSSLMDSFRIGDIAL